MEIAVNIDIEASIAAALAPEKLAPILDKHISDAITTAVRDATGYGSNFSKALKEQMKQALPHGLGIDDVMKFQQVLNASLRSVLHGANQNSIDAALKACVQNVMPDVPAKLKLSELIEEARAGFSKEKHEAFYAHWDAHDYGGGTIYLDGSELPSRGYGTTGSREGLKYNAQVSIAVTQEGEAYALKMRGENVTPSSRPTVITRFDSILMALYVGRTTLVVDMDDDEVESASREQWD